jgi:hypothetical protein
MEGDKKEQEIPSLGLNLLDMTQGDAKELDGPLVMNSGELGSIVDLTMVPDAEKTKIEIEEIEEKQKEDESTKESKKSIPESNEETDDKDVSGEDEGEQDSDDDSGGGTPSAGTDEESDEGGEEENEISAIGEVTKYFIEEGVLSDYGEDEEFDDSEEGFKDRISKTIESKVQDYKDSLSDLSKQYIEYLENGGRPQEFIEMYSMPDFSNISRDKVSEDENMQKAIVREFLRAQNYSAEEIDEEIQDYEDTGILDKKADRALGKLVEAQEQDRARFQEEQKQAKIRQYEKEQKMLEDLKTDIEKRDDIMGFQVSKKDKTDFYKYLTEIDKKTGKTRMLMDAENDPDAQLKMAYLYYKGFDFSKVEKKARTKNASNLKNNLDKFNRESRNKVANKGVSKVKKDVGSNLDMSMFKSELNL